MSSQIPVKNIYYLLAYAWNRLPESEIVDVAHLESQELADLLATVLINGIHHILRRGLDQAYVTEDAEIAGIRGKVIVGTTMRRMLAPHGRAHCEFDELKVDTLPNQILLATVRRLKGVVSIDPGIKRKLGAVERELGGISHLTLRRSLFRSLQLHRNNGFYRFLLSICELVLTLSLLDETSGNYQFRDFIRDRRAMAQLFESFVFNFYRIERPDLEIRKERIYWQASSTSDPELRYLPTMETDISVRDKPHSKTLIIDTKFYSETLSTRFDSEKIHSANLYQMVAYLENLKSNCGPDSSACGVLLYPVVSRPARLRYALNGHDIGICTVNLAEDWQIIREELNELCARYMPIPMDLRVERTASQPT